MSNVRLKFILSAVILVGLVFTAVAIFCQSQVARAEIGDETIVLEIAGSPKEHYQGLSDRPYLEDNKGMLFVFNDYTSHDFVMRRMNFPLDIIWIDDNKIIGWCDNLPAPLAGEEPAHCVINRPVNSVLEVNAGFIGKTGLKIGDSFEMLTKLE